MKLRVALLFVLVLSAAIVPVAAQTIYDNGDINGTTDGWTINFGFIVSDTWRCVILGCNVTGLSFGAWLFPGDVLQSAEVSITDAEFGGNTFFDGVVNFSQSNCIGNQYGYNVCTETGNFNVNVPGGDYWLNLQNASVNTGDPIYWDENSGPSQASENSVGTVPSEAFTILGTGTSTSTTGGTVPEPSSILLFGSGVLGLAGILRRKLY